MMTGKKPKASARPRASKPRASVARSNAPLKSGVKARPGAGAAHASGKEAARRIGGQVGSRGDWRAALLAEVRQVIHEADRDIREDFKWIKPSNPSGVPVWSRAGIVCTGETYKQVVKLTFARGAFLPDPHGLFNSSLEGSTRRAIDIREGESLDTAAFMALIRAAVAENLRRSAPRSPESRSGPPPMAGAKARPRAREVKSNPARTGAKPVLLSGGNPQIAKGDGDAPVQAYIAAMPGWTRALGERLDALIERSVPGVRKAVKWNSPFYGIEGQGWFLSFHVFTRYVKVTFFRGTSLRPVPPGGTPKSNEARWIDIRESDPLDEAQLVNWAKQAAEIPGWAP